MTMTGLRVFDSTVQKSDIWLKELMLELNWDDRDRAFSALRAVLHTLRDRLTVEEAAHVGAQLPMLIRGMFYEDWSPAHKPIKERHRDEFISAVRSHFRPDLPIDAEDITRSVFRLLSRKISEGEIEDVKRMMPQQIRELWEE
ncbi:MAG: DUF2267 domain-containing protein [Chitinispirillaceae bacterium]